MVEGKVLIGQIKRVKCEEKIPSHLTIQKSHVYTQEQLGEKNDLMFHELIVGSDNVQ